MLIATIGMVLVACLAARAAVVLKDAEAYYFRGFANYDRHSFKEAGEDFPDDSRLAESTGEDAHRPGGDEHDHELNEHRDEQGLGREGAEGLEVHGVFLHAGGSNATAARVGGGTSGR